MLHRSNAECSLWKDMGSRGEVLQQSSSPPAGGARAGTWREAVSSPARRPPAGRQDLLGSLRPASDLIPAAAVSRTRPSGAGRARWTAARVPRQAALRPSRGIQAFPAGGCSTPSSSLTASGRARLPRRIPPANRQSQGRCWSRTASPRSHDEPWPLRLASRSPGHECYRRNGRESAQMPCSL